MKTNPTPTNPPTEPNISLCRSCYCMTKTIEAKCGKCKAGKPTVEKWGYILKRIKDWVEFDNTHESLENMLEQVEDELTSILSHSVQEAKAERDREWMVEMYQMFGNSKGGRVGMAILSTLNTKASLKQEED